MQHKIILATVNTKKALYSTTADEFSAIAPNVQMGLLTAYIKSKNITVDVLDAEVEGISFDAFIQLIEQEEPLLVGFVCSGANPSSSTMAMAGIVDFFEYYNQVAQKPIKTFIWGSHPTVLPERTLRETGVDFIIRGEGYDTIVNLFHALSQQANTEKIAGLSYTVELNGETQYVHTPDVPLVKDLDTLPMVDWSMMPPSKFRAHNWHCFGEMQQRSPYAIVWTSFGCPYPCTFCCINNLFGKRTQRFRSIQRVIEEISLLVERYQVKHIKILDELFVTRPQRIEEFCDRLEEKGYDLNMWSYARVDTINRHLLQRLKKVGMNWISYGFETSTAKVLQDIRKGYTLNQVADVIKMTQDAGVSICADVMFGLWEEDYAAMQRTYDFLVTYDFEWANMYPVFVYPGTEPYQKTQAPESWKTYALYGYECVPAGTKYLSPAEVLRFRDEAFQNYHSRPAYLRMIEAKFGEETKAHILRMLQTPLKRRILGH